MSDTDITVTYNSCYTITFINVNLADEPTVIVCRNKESYKKELARLVELKHIRIVQHGISTVK
jgi:hypothetical protein